MLIENNKLYSKLYAQDLQLIQDFFIWKDESIKQHLLKDINSCIENQNFEWAAKLRDVYQNLHKFTEKQTVILDTFVDGILAKIIQVESQWIVIILIFQQWKLVDVIRTKESVDEVDIEQLVLWIELEFGNCKKINEKNNQIILSSVSKKLSKEILHELENHFDQFIASYIASGAWQKDSIVADLLKWLQQRYNFTYYPLRIECLDISHFSGDRASGGLSAMDGGVLNKKWYRRYKIKKAAWWDDYGSLREVILRRFSDSNYLPDLFVIDGAEKQLDVVVKLFDSWVLDKDLLTKVQFVSLGKWDARKSGQKIKGEKEKLYVLKDGANQITMLPTEYPLNFPQWRSYLQWWWIWFQIIDFEFQYDEVDRLLLRLRDEAHRFANSYREKQQSMELTQKKIITK